MASKSSSNGTTASMTARDYQHKRFRSRGAGPDSGGNQVTIDSTPPRIVTPPKSMDRVMEFPGVNLPPRRVDPAQEDPEDVSLNVQRSPSNGSSEDGNSFENQMKKMIQPYTAAPKAPRSPVYVHKQTSTQGCLTADSPMKVSEPMRYSLSKGGQDVSRRRASDGMATSKPKSSSSSRRSSDTKLLSSSMRKNDPNAYKIFLLLLQPQTKIFELIQLIYSPNDTTVGNILKMIPENATEAALGAQKYIGLCRPKTQEELLDQELLASETRPGVVSAKITLGEILVAIPKGFTGADVAALSKQILTNPKIIKLLRRADPLAPKKKRSSRHRSHNRHSSSRRSSSKEKVHILAKHDEEDDEIQQENQLSMKQAMEHAAAEAAAANNAISGGAPINNAPNKLIRSNSITSKESMDNYSAQESLDESYSSWSKSFDASFSATSSICSGVSKRHFRRRERQARRMRILQRSAAGGFLIMIAFYFFDTRAQTAHDQNSETMENPMGLLGIFQCLFLLLTLYKVERLVRVATNPNKDEMPAERRCPFLKASSAAMQRFRGKYSKKLKKSSLASNAHIHHHLNNHNDDDSLSARLRSFSLKAAAVAHQQDDRNDDTDTGSI
jgi:hypothetical protein